MNEYSGENGQLEEWMFRRVLSVLFLLLPLQALAAEALYIAAASDLVYCLEELNGAFRKTRPDALIKASTGSSGNFFAQIKRGAPFDVFMSADMKYPRELVSAGLADVDTLTPYATGKIVLWATQPKFDVSRGLELLNDPAVRRIAIANPEHAPYGRAAQAALEHAGLWGAVQARLVKAENITQTAQFVQSGNAEVGIVALSLAKSPKLSGTGRYYEIPAESYPRLEQGAVLTRKGAANPLAKAYLNFLRSPEARTIFDRYGFLLPG